MIGFREQKVQRRPVYSVTGSKLCYLHSGPEGEWIYTLSGKKLAKLTARHKAWFEKLQANQSAAGTYISLGDIESVI